MNEAQDPVKAEVAKLRMGEVDGGRITVPSSEEFSEYLQRITEAITSLAGSEQRYAVAVLDDILSQANADGRRTG